MIRGQSCLYGTTPDRHGWCISGGVGIVEAPADTLQVERIIPFVGMCLGHDHLLVPTAEGMQRVNDAGHEMHDHVREGQWMRPKPGSGVPGGGIMFRRTRVPATPGCEILMLAMCMYAPAGAVLGQMQYSLSGTTGADGVPGRMSMHSARNCAPLAENGIGMGALLQRPVWGWGEEPFALQSTMRLDVIDDAMETRRLLEIADRDAEQEARLQALRRTHGYDAVVRNHDPHETDFAEFRRRMDGGHPYDDWTKPLVASDIERRSEEASRVVRQIIDERKAA